MGTVFIYSLCDPDTLTVRYVGKTDKLSRRYWAHLHDDSKTYKSNWVQALKREGRLPKLQILEKIEGDNWEEAEKKWIFYYKNISGDSLTNTTEGGDGGSYKGFRKGHGVSEETRKKISVANKGRVQSLETRLKKSNSLKNPSLETRKKISEALKGRIFSVETRKKLSEAKKGQGLGRILSTETRKKMSKNRKGQKSNRILTEDDRKKLSTIHKNISFDTRQKMSQSAKNRKLNDETKRKISAAGKNRRHSFETRRKMSLSAKTRIRKNSLMVTL